MTELSQYQLFNLQSEKIVNKKEFYYLTHKGQGLYFKFSGLLRPQRNSQIEILKNMQNKMNFETEIRDYKGKIII